MDNGVTFITSNDKIEVFFSSSVGNIEDLKLMGLEKYANTLGRCGGDYSPVGVSYLGFFDTLLLIFNRNQPYMSPLISP